MEIGSVRWTRRFLEWFVGTPPALVLFLLCFALLHGIDCIVWYGLRSAGEVIVMHTSRGGLLWLLTVFVVAASLLIWVQVERVGAREAGFAIAVFSIKLLQTLEAILAAGEDLVGRSIRNIEKLVRRLGGRRSIETHD